MTNEQALRKIVEENISGCIYGSEQPKKLIAALAEHERLAVAAALLQVADLVSSYEFKYDGKRSPREEIVAAIQALDPSASAATWRSRSAIQRPNLQALFIELARSWASDRLLRCKESHPINCSAIDCVDARTLLEIYERIKR